MYPKSLPNTSDERKLRLNEITSVIGYNEDQTEYYCKMQGVDPELTCVYPKEDFNLLIGAKRNSLRQGFKQLAGID